MDASGKVPYKYAKVTKVLGRTGTFFYYNFPPMPIISFLGEKNAIGKIPGEIFTWNGSEGEGHHI